MGGIRVVDIVVGYETSTQPTSVTPSVDADVVTKGYADDTYTPKRHVYGKVTDINGLKAIPASARFDEQSTLVVGIDAIYKFDADSVATPDDDLIVQPTTGTGRWLKWDLGSGGASASGAGIDTLLQKLDNEKLGIFTNAIDNSIGASGVITPPHKTFVQRLMRNYAAATGVIAILHNPTFPWSSDVAGDSATGWSATGAAVSLAASNTAGDFRLGTHGLKFDKDSSATAAGIRFDIGAQTFSAYTNSRYWLEVKLPSLTGLVSIRVRVYADSTSNFATYTFAAANGQYDGSALIADWNTIMVDVSAAGTAGGTGWLNTQLARYVEVEVLASSSGQTYTGIVVEPGGFSYGAPQELGVIGDIYTLYNNSTQDDVQIASSNTRYDGPLTLVASVANAYVGTSGASRAAIERSKILIKDGLMSMDNDSGLSGTITTSQKIRLQTKLRESLSASYKVAVDVATTQIYKVTAVGGSSLGLEDPENTSANLVNTDILDLFSVAYAQGEIKSTYVGAMTVTSSSASGGTTTVNGTPPGGLVANFAYAVKRHLTSSKLSVVAAGTTNETLASLTPDTSPNGIILLDTARRIPYLGNLLGYFPLEGNNAGQKKFGSGPNLELVGTLQQTAFKSGHKGTTGWSTSNYYRIQNGSNAMYDNQQKIVQVAWLWPTDNTAEHHVAGRPNAVNNAGWQAGYRNSGLNIYMLVGSTVVTSSNVLTLNAWNHCVWQYDSGVTNGVQLWINGVLVGVGTGTVTSSGGVAFTYGHNEASGGSNLMAADIVAQGFTMSNVYLTPAEIAFMYNAGRYTDWGFGGQVRNMYTANGQSGVKATYEGQLSRTTTAITPAITNIAVLAS